MPATLEKTYTCCVCNKTQQVSQTQVGGWWHLTSYKGRFYGLWCSDCFDDISQTPNGEIIDKERYHKTAVRYLLKRSNQNVKPESIPT